MKHTYFTREQETWLRDNYYLVESYGELTDKFNSVFSTERNASMIRDKCLKQLGLKGMKNRTQYGNKKRCELPIGTIRKNVVGTYIKVAYATDGKHSPTGYTEPCWTPLQKKIYQDAYGELAPGKMVCFLDGNPQNFDLDNLYPIDRRISAIMSKNQWWTDSKEHTLTAIKWCELHYAIKEVKDGD